MDLTLFFVLGGGLTAAGAGALMLSRRRGLRSLA
jgi:hypothetical protein